MKISGARITGALLFSTALILSMWYLVSPREQDLSRMTALDRDASLKGRYLLRSPHKSDMPWTLSKCSQCSSTGALRFSEKGQDKKVWNTFYRHACACMGTYFEMGASDGLYLSNTKFFYDFLSWKGLLVEPQAHYYERLVRNRPNDVVYGYAICEDGLSQVNYKRTKKESEGGTQTETETEKMPCFKGGLAGLLANAKVKAIDFFSLDVDNSELTALKSMNWSIPVGLFLINTKRLGSDTRQEMRSLMTSNGYLKTQMLWDKQNETEDEIFEHPLYLGFVDSLELKENQV